MEWFTKILEAIRIPTKYFWIFLIVTSFFLFLPEGLLAKLGFQNFIIEYRIYISLVFLVSLSLIIVESFLFFKNKYKQNRIRKSFHSKLLSHLSKLDPKEKSVLREYFLQNQNTLRLPYDNPIVSGLIKKGILKIVGNIGEQSLAGMLRSIEINQIIKEEISLENIDLPASEELTESDKELIIKSRPDFLPEIEHHENLFHRGWWR